MEGLAPSHGDILILLYQNEDGVPMNKDKSTVTALINKLEKMGFIKKFKHESDSRSTMVNLTRKGLDTKPIVMDEISTKLLDMTCKGFSEEEKELPYTLLKKIQNNLKMSVICQ